MGKVEETWQPAKFYCSEIKLIYSSHQCPCGVRNDPFLARLLGLKVYACRFCNIYIIRNKLIISVLVEKRNEYLIYDDSHQQICHALEGTEWFYQELYRLFGIRDRSLFMTRGPRRKTTFTGIIFAAHSVHGQKISWPTRHRGIIFRCPLLKSTKINFYGKAICQLWLFECTSLRCIDAYRDALWCIMIDHDKSNHFSIAFTW